MARGLFTGRGAVGSKMRTMKEEEGKIARLRPELAPSSPERQLIKSPVERMVPEGSAKMVSVRPTVTQIAQDVQAPTERADVMGGGQVMGAVAPPAVDQGRVGMVTDKPISKEVARNAALDTIKKEVQASIPPVAEATAPAPQPVATAPAPSVQAPQQGQVMGAKATPTQNISKAEAVRRGKNVKKYNEMWGGGQRRVGPSYISNYLQNKGGLENMLRNLGKSLNSFNPDKSMAKADDANKSKRWWGGRFG